MDHQEILVWFLKRTDVLVFVKASRRVLGPKKSPVRNRQRLSLQEEIRWRRGADQSPLSSAKAKNEWIYASTPPYASRYFLGLTIDDSLSRKAHIDQMMSKLNTACFVIQTVQSMMSLETLRMVCFAYIHSIISYGIILFWEINHIVIRFSKFPKKG